MLLILVTYFTAANNGAVFSVGSMAFAQALPVKDFDNSASRLLNNVVSAFIKDGALPGRYWISDENQWR
jgi:N,N-dimethylformamidase